MSIKKTTFCRLCEPSCGLIAEIQDDQIISLAPDKDHPVTKGFACHKGFAMLDVHRDPDRMNYPASRQSDGSLSRISWDEAFTGIADRLTAIQDKYGSEAIASYAGNPLAFNSLAGPAVGSFLVKNGIRRNFSSGTQDCTNKFAGSEAVFGSSTIHPIPDIDHTDFLLIFGANPRVSHLSFFSIADPMQALRSAKARGAKIRFVDPRKNDTVSGIGEVLRVKPDTDVYLMAAILCQLERSGLFDEKIIEQHGAHLHGLIEFIGQYTPEKVAAIVGISAAEIEHLANEFSAAPSAAVYMSTGVNMGRQGTLAYWLLHMLSFVTGNLDRRGGNLYSLGFYPAARAGRRTSESPFFDSPLGEMRRIRGSLPGTLLPDMIEMEENPIRALVVISGNPLLSIGDAVRMRQALEKLEFILVIDIYQGATAELADYLLPATDMFEREDVNICGLGMQRQPYVQYTDRLVSPGHERKPEWWILARLEQTLGFDSVLDDLEQPDLFARIDHMLAAQNLSVSKLKLQPSATVVLPDIETGKFYSDWIQTEDKLVDCCPPLFEEAITRCNNIFDELANEQATQLKLISRRTIYMINSWLNNIEKLKRGPHESNPLYMHPDDARARNIGEGSTVNIWNVNGKLSVKVTLDESLRPGVVAMTHGWSNDQTSALSVVRSRPGVNANELLPSGPGSYEKLSNQAFMTGIPVEVEVA
jgi:anaerobic selenocysteine-containing dehydrogenase